MNTCMYMQCIYFDLICMWMDGWMDDERAMSLGVARVAAPRARLLS